MKDWWQDAPGYPHIMSDREYTDYSNRIERIIRSNQMAAKKPGVNPFAKGKAPEKPAAKGKEVKKCTYCGKLIGTGKGTGK